MLTEKVITIRKNDYVCKFPNVGQFMEIESMKISVSKGRYVAMSISEQKNHIFALDLADAISYLGVLIPNLKEELSIKSWWDIDLNLGKELILVYKKQFIPWFKPLLDDLYSYEPEDDGPDENK